MSGGLGKHVLWDVALVVNGIDLSDHVESVTLAVGQDQIPATPAGVRQKYSKPGHQTVTDPVITFYQDYAPGKVYATFLALWQNQQIFTIVGKAFSGARSPTNPEWTIPVFVGALPLLAGKRGDRHMAPVTCAVGGVLTIATS